MARAGTSSQGIEHARAKTAVAADDVYCTPAGNTTNSQAREVHLGEGGLHLQLGARRGSMQFTFLRVMSAQKASSKALGRQQ